jgi:hypothetical protein
VPFFQTMGGNNNGMSVDGGNNSHNNCITGSNGTSLVKPTPKRSRGRRVSCNPDNSGCKVFTCRFEDCGKIFKRSEHLKRHVRSIHTMEKRKFILIYFFFYYCLSARFFFFFFRKGWPILVFVAFVPDAIFVLPIVLYYLQPSNAPS